jgi:hypothetical protein
MLLKSGLALARRVHAEAAPRFVFGKVRHSVSMLALAFLVVHIVTSLLEPFAPIRLITR